MGFCVWFLAALLADNGSAVPVAAALLNPGICGGGANMAGSGATNTQQTRLTVLENVQFLRG